LAVYCNRPEIVSLLLEKGADIEAKFTVRKFKFVFVTVCSLGFPALIVLCLQLVIQDGQTMLHLASYHGYVEVVSFLLEKGADIGARDKVTARDILVLC
jgi:ankyrin repeat protein